MPRPSRVLSLKLASAFVTALAAYPAVAEPLTGDAGAAYSTPDGVAANPANAAFLDRSQIGMNPTLFSSDSYLIRYPGFETTSHGSSGIQAPLAQPTLIYKVSPRFGVGGLPVPPGISIPIAIKRIPLILLKTQNYVDITGQATLNGALFFNAGYRFGSFGIGVSGNYGSADIEAEVTPSEGGDPLVKITGTASAGAVGIGGRYDVVPGRFAVGVASDIVSIQSMDLTFESPLLGDGGGLGGEAGDPISVVNPLDSILFGAQIAFTPRFRLLIDAKFVRAAANAEQFSFTELKQKKKDVHDVLGVNAGVILGIGDTSNAMFGFKYQPSGVGPGRPATEGDEGLAGFGTMDVIYTFLPLVGAELTPYWQAGTGLQFGFAPTADRSAAKKKGDVRYFYAWTVATGVVYRRASLGIDETGEVPGAYLRTTTSIPVQITYRL